MAPLTDDRQYRLGLGMLAADRKGGLTEEQRSKALDVLCDDTQTILPYWRQRVDAYLEARHRREALDTHGGFPL